MTIFPAIDLLEGQVVRLEQGKKEARTVYGNDPAAFAQAWRHHGEEGYDKLPATAKLRDPIRKPVRETCLRFQFGFDVIRYKGIGAHFFQHLLLQFL